MNTQTIIGALIGFLTAVLADLQSFRKAQLQDPNAKLDWPLAILRWAVGAVGGAGLGLGAAEVGA